MQLALGTQISATTKQPRTSEATTAAAVAAHWTAMAQRCHLAMHTSAALKEESFAQRGHTGLARAAQSAAPCSLRLEDLLTDAGSSSSSTPSTSAASSPRGVPLSPLLGLPPSPEMAGAAFLPSLGCPPMAPPPGLSAPLSEEDSCPPPPPGLSCPARMELLPPAGLCWLPFRPPPGLPHPTALPSPAPSAPAAADSSSQRVEWCIHHVFSKLKTSAGFALVSPPLQVGEIPDVRLHFAPGEAWAQSMRSRKGKKTEAKVEHGAASGPMKGSLRLKIGDCGDAMPLKFNLFVGDVRQGPFECNFAERTVQEFQLDVDWRKHVEKKSESLCLRLEVLSE